MRRVRATRARVLVVMVAVMLAAGALLACTPGSETRTQDETADATETVEPTSAPEPTPEPEPEPLAPWTPVVVVQAGYGAVEGHFAYSPMQESDETKPDALAVSESGRVYIVDPGKSRIAVFDEATGDYTHSLTRDDRFLVGVVWTPVGVATIDWWAGPEVVVFDETGAVVAAHPVDSDYSHSISRLAASAEGVWIHVPDGWAKVLDAGLGPVPVASQPGTVQDGVPAGTHAYWGDVAAGGSVTREGGGDPTISASLAEADLQWMTLIGEDAAGRFFVSVVSGAGERCLVFDATGALEAAFDLEPDTGQMGFWLAADGTLYQLAADDTEVRVIRYAP